MNAARDEFRLSDVETPYFGGAAMVVVGVPLLFVLDVHSIVLLPLYAGVASLVSLKRRPAFAASGRHALRESRQLHLMIVMQAIVLGIFLFVFMDDLTPVGVGVSIAGWAAGMLYLAAFVAEVDARAREAQ